MNREFANKLLAARHKHKPLFSAKYKIHQFSDNLLHLLFPQFRSEIEYFTVEELQGKFALLERDLKKLFENKADILPAPVEEITQQFFEKIPQIYAMLLKDAEAICMGDPASESIDEVIAAYPGFYAIYTYRIAHEFCLQKVPLLPRVLTEYAHMLTGIDIHPGAAIGDSFFIDHGTGIVVGETSLIGNNVKLYQGVTLGALSVDKKLSQSKRHPTIEDNVVIYSNAVILGGDTVIGHDSIIGGNVWLTESVPAFSTVYHKSKLQVRQNGNLKG
jgi:serine O-acetyltransferase